MLPGKIVLGIPFGKLTGGLPVPAARTRSLGLLILRVLVGLAIVAVLGLTVGPRVAPYRVYIVLSGSMAPAIPTGSMLVARPVHAEEIHVGDIITYWPAGRWTPGGIPVTHRVIDIVEPGPSPLVLTRGDANPTADASRVRLGGIVWKSLFAIPLAGYALDFSQTARGRLLLLAIAAAMLLPIWRSRGTRPQGEA